MFFIDQAERHCVTAVVAGRCPFGCPVVPDV
jgi:hypothetical protein